MTFHGLSTSRIFKRSTTLLAGAVALTLSTGCAHAADAPLSVRAVSPGSTAAQPAQLNAEASFRADVFQMPSLVLAQLAGKPAPGHVATLFRSCMDGIPVSTLSVAQGRPDVADTEVTQAVSRELQQLTQNLGGYQVGPVPSAASVNILDYAFTAIAAPLQVVSQFNAYATDASKPDLVQGAALTDKLVALFPGLTLKCASSNTLTAAQAEQLLAEVAQHAGAVLEHGKEVAISFDTETQAREAFNQASQALTQVSPPLLVTGMRKGFATENGSSVAWVWRLPTAAIATSLTFSQDRWFVQFSRQDAGR